MHSNKQFREITKKINKYETVIASLKRQRAKLLNSKDPNKHTAAKCITIAIEAVKTQTPLKPRIEAHGYNGDELVYDTWRCPGCDYDYDVNVERYNHCPNCGQAIGWSFDGEWPRKL